MKAYFVQLPFALMRAGFWRSAVALQRFVVTFRNCEGTSRSLGFLMDCARLYRHAYVQESQNYPILLINRDCDRQRLERFERRARRFGLKVLRVDAVNAAAPSFDYGPFREQISETFYGKARYLRGAVGCFLSHVKAWRVVVESNSPGGLVCEDDARILGPLPTWWDDFGLPQDADLVFVNARMTPVATDHGGAANRFRFVSVEDALEKRLLHEPLISGPGGDGYLLTKRGAQTLLACFEEIRLSMELDWFLLFHSLTAEQREAFFRRDGTGRFDALRFSVNPVRAYVMIPALVEQASMGTTIGFDNPENYVSHEEIFEGSKTCD